MQAIVQTKYGSPDVLELRDIDKPEIGEHEVLIRVLAAGVNVADWAIMNGLPFIARPAPLYGLRKPNNGVRGTDVAGQIEAIGSGVTRFRPGDEVFGWATGAFAAFAGASEDALALKPADLTFEQAAAVPMAGLVALQALRDHAKVQPGQRVLINGASGGIGTFAVQIAKSLGGEVTGVCSARNVALVRSLGADHVIDYSEADFTRAGERYDAIFDNVGNHSLSELRRALSPTGTLVPNAGNFGNHWFAGAGRLVRAFVLFRFGRQRLGNFLLSKRQADLEVLKELIDAGAVTPVIDRIYPLTETRQAMRYVGSGHTQGKVAITVAPGAAA